MGIKALVVVVGSIPNMMSPFLTTRFCKTAQCPSSEILLRYRRRRLPIKDTAAIEIHLRACDFCSAELQLLRQHRNGVEHYRSVEVPPHLRRLAEDLLPRIADAGDSHQFSH